MAGALFGGEGISLPGCYLLKVRWGARVTSMALLVCVGVDEGGFREVLAVEVAGTEKGPRVSWN